MEQRALAWTVVTWNLQGSKRTDLDRVAEVLAAESPDVVVLQEVRSSQADDLGTALGMSLTWSRKHNPFHPFLPSRAEGGAILSPHGLRDPGHAVISDEGSLRSWRRRIAVWATVERADRSGYRVIGVHLSPHDDQRGMRLAEASRVATIAAEGGDSPPTIVAGDLNDHDDAEISAILPGVEHVTVGPTEPSHRPTQALDHVLLPADAHDVAVTVPGGGDRWAQLSDHLPVTVRFSLRWVQGDWAPAGVVG